MAQAVTQDQVVEAGRGLGEQFTRADVAGKLDVEVSDLKDGFKQARQAGQLEKVGEAEDGRGLFRLTAQ
jgi:hypothetical protein